MIDNQELCGGGGKINILIINQLYVAVRLAGPELLKNGILRA